MRAGAVGVREGLLVLQRARHAQIEASGREREGVGEEEEEEEGRRPPAVAEHRQRTRRRRFRWRVSAAVPPVSGHRAQRARLHPPGASSSSCSFPPSPHHYLRSGPALRPRPSARGEVHHLFRAPEPGSAPLRYRPVRSLPMHRQYNVSVNFCSTCPPCPRHVTAWAAGWGPCRCWRGVWGAGR